MKEHGDLSDSARLLGLSEAAAIAGCGGEAILKKGSSGVIPLFIRVPDDVAIYSTSQILLDLADPALVGVKRRLREERASDIRPRPAFDIELLLMSGSDCATVISQGEANQKVFGAGLVFEDGTTPTVVEPQALSSSGEYFDFKPMRHFVCYEERLELDSLPAVRAASPKTIKITKDLICVLGSDISKHFLAFENGFVAEAYMNPKLIKLNEAAAKYWNRSRSGWSQPSSKEVANWLEEEGSFSVKQALAGAYILRASYMDRELRSKSTMFDLLVQVAFAWKSSEPSDVSKYRNKSDALAFWISHGVEAERAGHLWQIVAPDHARKTGRPKKIVD